MSTWTSGCHFIRWWVAKDALGQLLAVSHHCLGLSPAQACDKVASVLRLGGGLSRYYGFLASQEKVMKNEIPKKGAPGQGLSSLPDGLAVSWSTPFYKGKTSKFHKKSFFTMTSFGRLPNLFLTQNLLEHLWNVICSSWHYIVFIN